MNPRICSSSDCSTLGACQCDMHTNGCQTRARVRRDWMLGIFAIYYIDIRFYSVNHWREQCCQWFTVARDCEYSRRTWYCTRRTSETHEPLWPGGIKSRSCSIVVTANWASCTSVARRSWRCLSAAAAAVARYLRATYTRVKTRTTYTQVRGWDLSYDSCCTPVMRGRCRGRRPVVILSKRSGGNNGFHFFVHVALGRRA